MNRIITKRKNTDIRGHISKILSIFIIASMIFCNVNIIKGEAIPDGTNVAKGKAWQSFSICTREDGGVWEDALLAAQMIKGEDYATEGRIVSKATDSAFRFQVVNSGWDGAYDSFTGEVIEDNPWGMTVTMADIPVEKGNYYTISFKIKSTLSGNKSLEDTDETEQIKQITTKHILLDVFNPESEEAESISILTAFGASETGFIALDSENSEYITVSVLIQVPEKYESDRIGVRFLLGAFLKSYPDEIGMRGYIDVSDFKVLAGRFPTEITTATPTTEKSVTDNKKSQVITAASSITKTYGAKTFSLNASTSGNGKLTYASNNSKVATVDGTGKVTVRGYGTTKITVKASKTDAYNEAYKEITLKVVPKKIKLKKVTSPKSKRISVAWKKDRTVTGYQIYISEKKNFKRRTIRKTLKKSKTRIKLAGLKRKKMYFVKIRAYKKVGNTKYYGGWSKAKKVRIK